MGRTNVTAIKLVAPNDRNGNPQRGWLIVASGPEWNEPELFVVEDYDGKAALRHHAGAVAHGVSVEVTQKEYRLWARGVYCPVARGQG